MSTKCGYVAIVGRPNVGKSTLLNRVLGQKISITSKKPQTTRHQILGIKTDADSQMIFVDTPGIHEQDGRQINKYMNKAARQTVHDVDVVLFLIEGTKWTEEDKLAAKTVQATTIPVIGVINKLDLVKDKASILPLMEQITRETGITEILPISAKSGENLDDLINSIKEKLPEEDFFYPEDQVTDRSVRFLAAEIVREKLTRLLGQELPYYLTVEIEQFKEEDGITRIGAVIWVERKGQKAIVIGKKGSKIKQVGTAARTELERLLECKVFLELWVRVKEGWSDDLRALRSLGYTDEQ